MESPETPQILCRRPNCHVGVIPVVNHFIPLSRNALKEPALSLSERDCINSKVHPQPEKSLRQSPSRTVFRFRCHRARQFNRGH